MPGSSVLVVPSLPPNGFIAGVVVMLTTDGALYQAQADMTWRKLGPAGPTPIPADPWPDIFPSKPPDAVGPCTVIAIDNLRSAIKRGPLTEKDWRAFDDGVSEKITAPVWSGWDPGVDPDEQIRFDRLVSAFKAKPDLGTRTIGPGDWLKLTVPGVRMAGGFTQVTYEIDHLEYARICLVAYGKSKGAP